MKKRFGQRAAALLLTLACMISLLPTSAFAAGTDAPDSITLVKADYGTGTSYGGLQQYTAPNGLGTVTLHNFRMNVGGKTVTGFCGDHTKTMGNRFAGETWNNKTEVSPNLYPLLAFYYWSCENNANFNGGETGFSNLVTNTWIQCALWLQKQGKLPDYKTDREGYVKAVAEQRDAAYAYYKQTPPDEWTSETDIAFRLDQYAAGAYGSDWSFYEYNYAGSNGDPQPVVIGWHPESVQSYQIKKVDTSGSNVANVTFHVESADGSFSTDVTTDTHGEAYIESSAGDGWYTFTETSVPDGYNKTTNPTRVYLTAGMPSEVKLVNSKSIIDDGGNLTIQKVDADNPTLGLPGAVIKLVHVQSGDVYTFVTGDGGFCNISEDFVKQMHTGVWYAEETTAPENYRLNTDQNKNKQVFNWDGTTPVSLVFENDSKVQIRFRKVNESGTGLPGAVIAVYQDGKPITTQTTDSNGYFYVNGISEGYYTFEEISAPEGYALSSFPYASVHIDSATLNGAATVDVQMINYKKPQLTIQKIDAKTGAAVPGTVFEVRGINNNYSVTVTTGPDGSAVLDDLENGAYEVTEKSVPSPYILDTNNRQTVALTGGDKRTITFTNSTEPGLRILKKDAITGDPVPGVTFRVEKLDGTYTEELTTDKNGEIFIEHTAAGAYRIEEIAVPGNFLLSDDVKTVTLEADKTTTVEFVNFQRPGLLIQKVDSDGNALSGVKFNVKLKDGAEIGTYTTDKNGEIFIPDLDAAWYTVTETFAPEDYILDTTPHDVLLEEGASGNGKGCYTLRLENLKKPELTIKKVDTILGDGVEGAKFEIFYAGTGGTGAPAGTFESLGTKYSDKDGYIKLDHLKEGWYRVKEVEAPDGFQLNDPSTQEIYLRGDEEKELVFKDTPLSAIVVLKKDGVNGKAVPGATFQLRYLGGTSGTEGTVIGEKVTGQNGTAIWTRLKAGTYIVEETKPAAGYSISEATKTVYISGKDQDVITVAFDNAPDGTLLIKKVSSTNSAKTLSGAEFKVQYTDGTVIGQNNGIYTTDVNGEITISGLEPEKSVIVTETKAPDGYTIDETPQTIVIQSGKVVSLTFKNAPDGGLIIEKRDSVTKLPLPGATFRVTNGAGTVLDNYGGTVSSNGLYTTGPDGLIRIYGVKPDTYVVTEVTAPDGYLADAPSQTVRIYQNDTQTLTFYDTPLGGLTIVKKDADTGKRLEGAKIEVAKMNGEIIGTYTTDKNGLIQLPDLDDGWYQLTETKAPTGYLLDSTPQKVEVKKGETKTFEFENTASASMLIHKIDSETGEGIPGVKFVVYDSSMTPIGEYESDNNGYVHLNKTLTDGKYYVREIVAADGYILDNNLKTFTVLSGDTAMIEWKNTAERGQIQIVKTSADYNSTNGTPAGTPLSGAVYTIYDKRMNVVDNIKTNSSGVATSKQLPLSIYYVVETTAPTNYGIDSTKHMVELEFSGQVQTLKLTNASVNTGVSIKKSGPAQVINGQNMMRYTISGVSNDSTCSLNSFYWRDTLPTDAFRMTKLVTGTYSHTQVYKVTYNTNLNSTWRTAYDNLSTAKSYTLNMSGQALGLASNEYITQVMLNFGTVPAGFHQTGNAAIYGSVLRALTNGYQFTNKADVGGLNGSYWVQGIARWTTSVYSTYVAPTPTLPRTGY